MRRGSAFVAVVLATSWLSIRGASADATIYESATYVPVSGGYSGFLVTSDFWQGAAFTTTETHHVTALGGHIRGDYGGDPLFLAIFPTDGSLPPAPPNTDDAFFIQLVTPPTSPSDYSLPTDFMLPPGNWAVIFGSGMAGATGEGNMPQTNLEVGTPTYVRNIHGSWSTTTSSRLLRLFVEGTPIICGDGTIEGDEVCDDGANNGLYGFCKADCTGMGPSCGDGQVQSPNETCDDGANNGQYGFCNATCSALGPRCGDGIIQGAQGEVCDDASNNGEYGFCDAACGGPGPRCGDGTTQESEACDDGDNNGEYGFCNATCSAPGPYCGDGLIQPEELCDAGPDNGSYGGPCNATCTAKGPHCSDGVTQEPETCDDGNVSNRDACLNTCRSASCGDGFVQAAVEECDDGNNIETDGCSNACIKDDATPRTIDPPSKGGGCQISTDPSVPYFPGFLVAIVLAVLRHQHSRRHRPAHRIPAP